jgi:hypothetical protein
MPKRFREPHRSRPNPAAYVDDRASCWESGPVNARCLDDGLVFWGRAGWGRERRRDEPFRRPPGGSHAQLPDMAFPNLSNLNLFPFSSLSLLPISLQSESREPLSHTPSSHRAPSPSPSSNHPKKPFSVPKAKLKGVSVGCVEYFVASLRT